MASGYWLHWYVLGSSLSHTGEGLAAEAVEDANGLIADGFDLVAETAEANGEALLALVVGVGTDGATKAEPNENLLPLAGVAAPPFVLLAGTPPKARLLTSLLPPVVLNCRMLAKTTLN